MKIMLKKVLAATALAALPLAGFANEPPSAVSDIVGYVTLDIQGSSNGVNPAITFFAPPLVEPLDLDGIMAGRVSSFTENTVSVTDAGWSDNQFVANGPAYIQIRSGDAEGLILRIVGNSSDTATVENEGIDLTSLGIAANQDTFQVILGYTMNSLFGSPDDGVIGGTPADFASGLTDRIIIKDNNGVIRTLYFNTTANQWRRGGSGADQGNLPISPYAGVLYYRISQDPISMQVLGTVALTASRQIVPKAGVHLLSRFHVEEVPLAELGFQDIPSWRSTNMAGVTIANADKVVAKDNAGVVRSFYYDGTQWRRGGSGASQDNVLIPIGSAVYTNRFGDVSGPPDILVQSPFYLN